LNPKKLVVEGRDEQYSIPELMKANGATWPDGDRPVEIVDAKGRENIFKAGYLSARLKEPEVRVLGIVLDAEDQPNETYARIRHLCLSESPGLPTAMSPTGVITETIRGMRLGLWIMPDNLSEGNLESFLRYLVPRSAGPLWIHATESVSRARSIGATCRECHIEKANLHTYLAWQDEPGYPFGTALSSRILDPLSEHARPFVKWFRELFNL
jgi:hypothetical protein